MPASGRGYDAAKLDFRASREKPGSRVIPITEPDLIRLRALLGATDKWNVRDRQQIECLRAELDRATIVQPQQIPVNTVTLNSKVLLTDLHSGESMTWTLVLPGNADFEQSRISVLAPIGIAMIGRRTGEVVGIDVPSGRTQLKIEAVSSEPEASERPSR